MAYARDSDLWSLGAAATLVHVATGHRTFEAKSDTLWCFAVAGDMDAAAPSVLRLPRPRRAQPATAAASARPPAFDPVLYGRPARALLVASHALAALARARFDNNLALASDQRDGAGGPWRRGGDAGPHRRRLGDARGRPRVRRQRGRERGFFAPSLSPASPPCASPCLRSLYRSLAPSPRPTPRSGRQAGRRLRSRRAQATSVIALSTHTRDLGGRRAYAARTRQLRRRRQGLLGSLCTFPILSYGATAPLAALCEGRLPAGPSSPRAGSSARRGVTG